MTASARDQGRDRIRQHPAGCRPRHGQKGASPPDENFLYVFKGAAPRPPPVAPGRACGLSGPTRPGRPAYDRGSEVGRVHPVCARRAPGAYRMESS